MFWLLVVKTAAQVTVHLIGLAIAIYQLLQYCPWFLK